MTTPATVVNKVCLSGLDAIALAEGARGPDRFGYRNEFLNLARLAKSAAAMAPLRQ